MSKLTGSPDVGAANAGELPCSGPLGATDVQGALDLLAGSTSLPAPGPVGNALVSNGAIWTSSPTKANKNGDTLTSATLTNATLTGTFDGVAATSVTAPTVTFPSNSTDVATTAFVSTNFATQSSLSSGLAAKVNASGGTLTNGTIAGTTSITGTTTAGAAATIDLDAAASVTVPLVAPTDDTNAAASTAHVKDYLPAPGAAGTVHRSDGTAWQTALLAAADVSAAGPYSQVNVQAALDQLRLRLGGTIGVVDTLADLDIYAPAIAGVRTILQPLLVTGAITLNAGERVVFGNASAIIGITSARCSISGNYAGPLFSGPVIMQQMGISNVSGDPAASVFAISDVTGRTIRLEYSAIGAGAKAGTIGPTTGVVSLDRVFFNGCNNGFVMSGILAVFEAKECAAAGMTAGAIMFDFGATTNIIRAMALQGCSLISVSTLDRLVRIHSSATLPGGALPTTVVGVNILHCKVTGPAGAVGRIYDTGASTYDPESPRIIILGCPAWPDSRFLADADFENFTTPILTTYTGPAPTAWVPVAHQNAGPTSVLFFLNTVARFTLVRNVADPLDWYIRYDGPVTKTYNVRWSVTIEANAGGGAGQFIEYRAEVDPGGLGVWAEIQGSNRRIEQTTTASSIACESFFVSSPGDRFRLASRNVTGTGTTRNYQYDLIVSASSS